jgi:hypothetical protein
VGAVVTAAEVIDAIEHVLRTSGTPAKTIFGGTPDPGDRRLRTPEDNADAIIEIEQLVRKFRVYGRTP